MTGEIFISLPAFLSKYYDFGFTIYQTERIYKISRKTGSTLIKMLYLKYINCLTA